MIKVTFEANSIDQLKQDIEEFMGLEFQVQEVETKLKNEEPKTLKEAISKRSKAKRAKQVEEAKAAKAEKEASPQSIANGTSEKQETAPQAETVTKETVTKETEKETAPPKEDQATKPAPAAATSSKSKADVHQALQKLNLAKGIQAARDVLKIFGAEKLSDLEDKNYDAFCLECEKAGQ